VLIDLSHRIDDLQGRVHLDLLGGHTLWSDYRKLLKDLNPAIATYIGGVPAKEVGRYLAEADLLVQPSKYEPFGLTVGEGLASGIPVIATDQVGAAEDVDRGCCEVIPAADPEALEVAVRSMVARLEMGDVNEVRALARREAERLFAPTVVAKGIADILVSVARSE
jgi:glycosyltransferase involved in cell wall biosynthesis